MRWEKCEVCNDTRPAGEVSPHEDIHFGYCPHCGGCLGRWLLLRYCLGGLLLHALW